MELTTRATQSRSGVVATLVTMMFLCSIFACNAQDSFPPKELTFHEGFGSRKADRRMYVLTGCCWIRGIRFGDPDQFVTMWIAQHPLATITPVSKMPIKSDEWVYVWIADRDSSLNVDLVRAGIYPGAAMGDMHDNDKGLTELLKNPKLADARAIVEKERSENPQNRPKRLESEDEYNRQMDQIKTAETEARKEKMGIWSDSMKEECKEIGLP
jgi:hypothetical protein